MALLQQFKQLRQMVQGVRYLREQGLEPMQFVARRREINSGIEGLKALHLEKIALQPGQAAPLFETGDAWGKPVSLPYLLQQGPVLLIFYRGNWCPACNMYLHAIQSRAQAWQEIFALRSVAISPEKPDESKETIQRHELGFDVVSDVSLEIARLYGLVYELPDSMSSLYEDLQLDIRTHNASADYQLPIPATYLIATTGEIVWAHVDADYRQRPELDEIQSVLRRLKS